MKRVTCSLLALGGLLAAGVGGPLLWAQENKGLSWKHGLNFQVRKAGQTAWKGAPKYGSEIFLDRDIDKLVYIAETGAVGVGTTAGLRDRADVDPPRLYHGLELRVRPVGATSWDKAEKFGVEVFKDANADNLVYISEKGSLAVIPSADVTAPDKIKDPEWFHGLELKVRKAGEKEFTDKTKKVSLEVYLDPNTRHLVYVTDEGRLAAVPARESTSKPSEVKGPTWHHAFEVKVRKADEEKFTRDTRAFGVEVYKDENTNNLLYITEAGAIAVVPAGGATKPSDSKEPRWLYGRSFRVRTADMPDFNDKTPRQGAEIYLDENTGSRVYLTDSGAIAVFAAR